MGKLRRQTSINCYLFLQQHYSQSSHYQPKQISNTKQQQSIEEIIQSNEFMEIEEFVDNNNLNCQMLNSQDIVLQHRIGRGAQGSVYTAFNKGTKQKYAVKVMNIGLMSPKEKQRLNSEIRSNFTLSNVCSYKNFPYFYGYWLQQSQICLAFQLCQGNALEGIKTNRTHAASYSFAYVLLYDIMKGLEILEKKNIIHRDLKPENMLLHQGKFKICDLGLSKIAEVGKKLTIDVGNLMSRSPQSYSQAYDCRTDIWSLGINVYWIAFGTLPFDEDMKELLNTNQILEIKQRISRQNFEVCLIPIPTLLLTILKDMLEMNRFDRLFASQLLNKYFFQQITEFSPNSPPETQFKQLLFLYLKHRTDKETSSLLLVTLLLAIDYEKVDEYLKSTKINRERVENNKRQICRRVKINIYMIMIYIVESYGSNYNNEALNIMGSYCELWDKQLRQCEENRTKLNRKLRTIEDGLKMHQIHAIKERFPLVVEAVKIMKNIETEKETLLWEISSLDLRMLKI